MGAPRTGIASRILIVIVALFATVAAGTPARAESPNPILVLVGTENYSANGQNWVRHRYDVANKDSFPNAMFEATSSLPPCGLNRNSSRSWVDFFDSRGKRLYGFCALGSAANLGKIWFATEEGSVPPSYVYIVIHDRQTHLKYKSNLAETGL
jgi:hypothetical protein